MNEKQTQEQSQQPSFPTQPPWVPTSGGYRVGEIVIVFASSSNVGKSFFFPRHADTNVTKGLTSI